MNFEDLLLFFEMIKKHPIPTTKHQRLFGGYLAVYPDSTQVYKP